MRKDARLSFRISHTLSGRVDKAIHKSAGQIRDRSEFGTKAIQFYLDYIENTQSEEEIIFRAILGLSENVGYTSKEIDKIGKILNSRMLIPKTLSSNKMPETHPDFEKLLELREKLDAETQKELSNKLRDITYDEITDLYETYHDQYHMKGTKKRKTEKIKN